jgi:hypothetical protein
VALVLWCIQMIRHHLKIVMPGLEPGIYGTRKAAAWEAGWPGQARP